jgi:hypothetical protein
MTGKPFACIPALIVAAFLAAPAMAQNTGKNPADACKGMDKAGKAYSDCVKAQAQQQQQQQKNNANAQADKKPGQTCAGMDKASQAYSDCVKAQAQTTKDSKPAATGNGANSAAKQAVKKGTAN